MGRGSTTPGKAGSRGSSKSKQLSSKQIAENNALNEAQAYITNTYITPPDTPKFDSSKIKVGDTISGGLINTDMFIENIPQSQRFVKSYDARVIRATEKAVQLDWNTEFGHVKSWFPKSTIGNNKKSFSKGIAYNEALRVYASKLGIKGITMNRRLKTDNIINAIEKAGYSVPKYSDMKFD